MFLLLAGSALAWVVAFFTFDNSGTAFIVSAGVLMLAWPREAGTPTQESLAEIQLLLAQQAAAQAETRSWWRR